MAQTQSKPGTARRQAAQRRRTHNMLLTGVFLLLVILVLLINLIAKDRTFSDTENRNLTQKPAFSLAALADGSYFSGLNDWYNDQFFARDRWISLNLRETKLLGQQESGGVYLGPSGWLISDPESPDEALVAETTSAMNQFSADHPEISTQLLLVPGASAILSDKLPKNAPVRDQLQDIDDVWSQLSSDIQFLDATSALQAHVAEDIYYKTDHHWTSLGAYYVFSANTGALGIDPVSSYDIYTVTTDFEGTLASKSGSHAAKDSIEIYDPKDTGVSYYLTKGNSTEKTCSIYSSAALDVKDKYTVFFGGNYDIIEIRTTADNGRNLLVFKDSYANCFMQFLVPYYERIIMIDPRYYYDSLESVLNYGITDVLYLYSADTFLTDGSLLDVLTAAQTPVEDAVLPEDATATDSTAPGEAATSPSPDPSQDPQEAGEPASDLEEASDLDSATEE